VKKHKGVSVPLNLAIVAVALLAEIRRSPMEMDEP
jgi:hypothetical protein